MSLLHQSEGNYEFIPSTAPLYCKGVIADAGYQIVHSILHVPLPYQAGLALVERYLAALGQPRGPVRDELRCAVPYTEDGWRAPDGFNAHYVALLRNWDLFVAGHNPVARTNVAPTVMPPAEQVLYGFSYTVPASDRNRTFVLSGAGENPGVRPGETSLDALHRRLRMCWRAGGAPERAWRDLGSGNRLRCLHGAQPACLAGVRDPRKAGAGGGTRSTMVPQPATN